MENKTAIQKLAAMIEDRIGVSTMADQSKEGIVGYQMALVGIKLELKHLLELEKEQIIKANDDGALMAYALPFNAPFKKGEEYYNETYGSQAPQRLKEANEE
jgi:hypothetical protein